MFSSVDLTGKSTDDIRQMTDIEPQELVVDQSSTRLQTLDEPVTDQQQNPETVVRAIAVNDPLTAANSGFYVRTFGLYATDDQGNTVLYGVSLDSHPAYMPQFQGQEQRLAFDWDEDTSDKANIQFTNVHTAYVTWWDFQQFSQAIKSGVDSTEATLSTDNASLASSVNSDMASGSSALSSHSVSMTSFANSMATSLTDSVNGLPHWADENWTRNVIAPSLATSAANSAGASAINQANTNMDYNKNSLNGRVNALPTWDDMNWTRGQARNYADSAKSAAQATAATGDYNVSLNATNYTNGKADSAVNQANANMETNRRNLQSEIDAQLNVRHQLNSTSPDGALDTITDTGVIGGYGANIKQGFPIDNFWGDVFCYYDNAYTYGYQIAVSVDSDDNKWFRSVNLTFDHGSFKKAKWHYMPNDADIDSLNTNIQNARNDLTQTAESNMRHAITVVEDDLGSTRQDLQGQIDANNNGHNATESNLQDQINKNQSDLATDTSVSTYITNNSPEKAINTTTHPCVLGIHYAGTKQGAPYDAFWGDIYVMAPDNYGYVYQIAIDVYNHMYYRGQNMNFVDNNFNSTPWTEVANKDDINSLQDQINNNVNDRINQAATNAMNQAISTANSNMETNRENLQGQIDEHTQAKSETSITNSSSENALDQVTSTCVIGVHSGGKTQGLPQDNMWGDVQVYSPDWYGYAYQILMTIGSDVWYRAVNLSFNNGNFHNVAWTRVTEQVQAANDEQDAQNQSGQHPGTLFVYSD